ncbi:MMPL family transporter [Rhodococcus aetherivorans]|uniref:MMPL family transporter n=1 Tax=Rhodococcus aetherivorans TaxID=191292 RepID=A0AA46NYH3_9NOCA|nr:MMPL family transporter [Rhodococcus aetherivorans]UYF96728.1 MMPL family transporter [Rhodococcus aetherivorans]
MSTTTDGYPAGPGSQRPRHGADCGAHGGAGKRDDEPRHAASEEQQLTTAHGKRSRRSDDVMLTRLATLIVDRPRRVLAGALAFLVLAGVFGTGVSAELKVGGFDDPGSESSLAEAFLDERFGGSTPNLVLQVTARAGDVNSPEVMAAAQRLERRIAAEPEVTEVGSYWTTRLPDLRSTDGRSGLVLLHVGGTAEQAARHTTTILAELPEDPAVRVAAGGKLGLTDALETHVAQDLKLAESIALPATLLLLIIVFGSVVAALLPLSLGVASILATMLVLFVLAQVTDVSVYALTVATAFGLGLAIDFGLLLVSRFREERAAGHPPREAVIESVATAGRTILFSAATVTVAMGGMLVFPIYFLRSVGFAAMAVVVTAAVSAVVVLPAILALLGGRIDSLAVRRRRDRLAADSPFWRRTAAAVTRRPVRAALPVLMLLLLMGLPVLHARFATPDERALPVDSAARQVTTAIRDDYAADSSDAAILVARNDAAALERVAREVSALDEVARVDGAFGRYQHGMLVAGPGPQSARFTADDAGYVLVEPTVDAQSEPAQDLVHEIRALPAVAENRVAVGGPTATLIDSNSAIAGRLPSALALLAVSTFVLLFLFTGSMIVPIKALLLNVFVLIAVIGAMVWLFQDGHLAAITGVTPAPLNIGMVVLLCCIAFSLSVDYEIFLLSRIKEARDGGADTTEATIEGLGRVGRIVSSAAALLTVTLLSFSTGLSFMQMFGIGTALAVLMDATLVRGVLVPAFMRVAGEFNWWAPGPLRRLHARIGVRESPRSSAPAGSRPGS